MSILLDFSPEVRDQLEAAFGHDLATAAREALAIEGYRAGKLSLGQVGRILGMSPPEADTFLHERGVPLNFTPQDLADDVATMKRISRR